MSLTIRNDISLGMALLPCALPSIERLDISIDICDCIGQSTTDPNVSIKLRELRNGRCNFTTGPLMSSLGPLADLKNVANVDIRIFWDDYYQHGRSFWDTLSKTNQEEMQDLYIKELQQQIPAKSITGHLKNTWS
jgi:hypothetical protein